MPAKANWEPGARLSEALAYAVETHASQGRKGSGTPYIAHLLGVCGLVIEDGGSEDEAIAALLHDAAEDQGGEATLDEIEDRFGLDVRRIVAACSDTFETPKPPWEQRKADYIAGIASRKPTSCASRSPTRCTTRARSCSTTARWGRASSTASTPTVTRRSGTTGRWPARSRSGRPGPLADELVRVVDELEQAVP